MTKKFVSTKSELKSAINEGIELIVITSQELADNLQKAQAVTKLSSKTLKSLGLCVIAIAASLVLMPVPAAPVATAGIHYFARATVPMIAEAPVKRAVEAVAVKTIAADLSVDTATAIAIIIAVSTLGIVLVVSVFKDYNVEFNCSHSDWKATLRLKKS